MKKGKVVGYCKKCGKPNRIEITETNLQIIIF